MNRLRELRIKTGKSMSQVAKDLRIAYTTYAHYETCAREPNSEMLIKLANFFDVSIDYLICRTDNPKNGIDAETTIPSNVTPVSAEQFICLPVIGRVAAGKSCYAETDIIDYEYVLRDSLTVGEDYVFLRVIGDSMYPDFRAGDNVLVRCQSTANNGEIAVVIVDNEDGVVKRISYGDGWFELQSINPMYAPRRFEGKEIERLRIFGVVKKCIRNY